MYVNNSVCKKGVDELEIQKTKQDAQFELFHKVKHHMAIFTPLIMQLRNPLTAVH